MGQTTHFQGRLSTLGSVHLTSKKMNGTYALALILAPQVSMSLCEVPAPDQELVDKYEAMKATFYKRILNAYHKLQAAAVPAVEKIGENPHVQGAVKIITGVAQEAAPLVDKARTSALGAYGHYVRPHIGTYLNDGIEYIKTILDRVLPAEA